MSLNKKILFVGIGAIGGVFSYKLIKEGYSCQLVSQNENIADMINRNGIILHDGTDKDSVTANAETKLPQGEQFDFIFLMMKTTSIRVAAEEIKKKNLLKENGLVITIQNGDIYDEISDLFPKQIVTCIIVWGASMVAPGEYRITSPGKTVIGDRNNTIDLNEIQILISKISPNPVELSTNIVGVIWSKLCLNCAINAISGISSLKVGEYSKLAKARELFLATYRESFELTEYLDIKLEKLVIKPSLFYIPKKSNFIKKIVKTFFVKRVGKKFGLVKTSMLQDLERGRKTEIDYLNGYVSKKGKEVNYPTPVNDKLTEIIKLIEKGELQPNIENFDLIDL